VVPSVLAPMMGSMRRIVTGLSEETDAMNRPS
jgi:hypothetical protein